jgi:hypothetical protein
VKCNVPVAEAINEQVDDRARYWSPSRSDAASCLWRRGAGGWPPPPRHPLRSARATSLPPPHHDPCRCRSDPSPQHTRRRYVALPRLTRSASREAAANLQWRGFNRPCCIFQFLRLAHFPAAVDRGPGLPGWPAVRVRSFLREERLVRACSRDSGGTRGGLDQGLAFGILAWIQKPAFNW